MTRRLQWLEVTPSYACNQRCVGCFSAVEGEGPVMSSRELGDALAEGLRQGARSLWVGGGEPTLRRELLGLVREARRMGYARVKLQTNAMMLAYEDAVRRCREAGVTEVNVAIKGATAETHDALTQTPGAFELLVRALGHCQRAGLALEGDVLLYRRNLAEIPAMVRTFHGLGVRRFNLWSLHADRAAPMEVERETFAPRDVVPHLVAAMDAFPDAAPDFLTALHVPACVLPAKHRRARFNPRDLDLLVTNPGGHAFRLEASPMEGGVYLDGCARCALRGDCNGLRAADLDRTGSEGFEPL